MKQVLIEGFFHPRLPIDGTGEAQKGFHDFSVRVDPLEFTIFFDVLSQDLSISRVDGASLEREFLHQFSRVFLSVSKLGGLNDLKVGQIGRYQKKEKKEEKKDPC
ncbi:MAG: hypothetical protein DDT18_01849 [Actinobacteria bacterium]|nr:hypothetical protein [Actinomycetota bacterium]